MLLMKLPTVGNSTKEVCSLHLISSNRGQENSTCCAVSFSLGQQGQKGYFTFLLEAAMLTYHLCHVEFQFTMFSVQPYVGRMSNAQRSCHFHTYFQYGIKVY